MDDQIPYWGKEKPPGIIPMRVTRCSHCGVEIFLPEQDWDADFLKVIYNCNCPRRASDLDPVIHIRA